MEFSGGNIRASTPLMYGGHWFTKYDNVRFISTTSKGKQEVDCSSGREHIVSTKDEVSIEDHRVDEEVATKINHQEGKEDPPVDDEVDSVHEDGNCDIDDMDLQGLQPEIYEVISSLGFSLAIWLGFLEVVKLYSETFVGKNN